MSTAAAVRMINGCYVCFSPVNYSWLASVTRCGLAWLWNAADLMSCVCVSVIHHHTQTTQQCVCLCVHMCVVWERCSCCCLRSYLPNTHTATEIHTHSWRVVLIPVQQVLPLMTKAAWKAAKAGLNTDCSPTDRNTSSFTHQIRTVMSLGAGLLVIQNWIENAVKFPEIEMR